MKLTQTEIERLIDWAREVFVHTNAAWDIEDDKLLGKLERARA